MSKHALTRELARSAIAWNRPFRAKEIAERGGEPCFLRRMCLPDVKRIDRGLYCGGNRQYARIQIALMRLNCAMACLGSALFLHGLLDEEPPEAWVLIDHKAWKPRESAANPMRVVRTSRWPQREDWTHVDNTYAMTGLERTVVDFFRYRHLVPPSMAKNALGVVLDSGRTTMDAIRACADRCFTPSGSSALPR